MVEFTRTSNGFELQLGTVPTLILLALWIFSIVVQWKIYTKAYVAGWNCLIPFLSSYRWFQIAGMNPVFIFFLFLPIIGWIVVGIMSIIARFKIVKLFGGSDLLAVLSIFFSLIIMPILAFSGKYYYGGSEC